MEWSNRYRRLPKESSVEPGLYRTSRTPYVEEPLRELSPQSPTQEVIVVKPTQVGFTELGNNFLFGTAHLYPGPSMMAMPTDAMALKHSKKKVAPSVRAMPCLKGIIKEAKSRDSGNTLLLKEFPGGSWTFTGSNSPASARSDSIRYLILDDYDGFVQEAGTEGSPGDLFRKRTDAFGGKKKIYINSTPTLAGTSHIEREWADSSQGLFNVPCPHCGEYQFMEFGGKDSTHGIKFTRDDDGQVIDVWYTCKHCHARVDEWQKTEMMARGKYIHTYPDRKKRGFKINALYSPVGWLSWSQIVVEFLQANEAKKKGSTSKMKVWVNTRAAETWEEEGDQPEWAKLSARAEPYRILTVPWRGQLVVAGVDTQDNRLEVVVMAYGKGEESWVIYRTTIYGNPDQPEVWRQLDEILGMQFQHESGAGLHIESMAVDTGGHKTQAVYQYCRSRGPVAFAIKGQSQPGKPVYGRPTAQDVDYLGKTIKNGVQLYPVGSDVAKGVIYNRLRLTDHGPGYIHFPIGLDDDFYLQLTAEKNVKRYDLKGREVREWVKVRERNDVLDCFVYAYAAALKAGVQHRNWEERNDKLQGVANGSPVNSTQPKRRVLNRGIDR